MRSYAVTFVVFLVLELTWLVVIAKDLYQKELGYIMSPKPNLVPTVIFSLIFVLGLVFFVVNPALEKNSWTYALFAGILYGLATYSTYTLTNFATLEGWPVTVSMIDLMWGSSLGAMASTISFFILKLFK